MNDGSRTSSETLDAATLVELYAARDGLEAERLALLLADAGIEALTRQSSMAELPIVSDTHHFVLVRDSDQEAAAALIRQAIADEVVSTEGMFIQGAAASTER